MSMSHHSTEFADLTPLNRAKEQKAWYWYVHVVNTQRQ